MINIICKKYSWTSSQPSGRSQRNFFNTTPANTPTYLGQIDLYDYLVRDSLSEVEYGFDVFDFNTNKLASESSSVSLKVNNLKEITAGQHLADWFVIYKDIKINYKYLIDIYKDGVFVYRGILYNEGIKFNDRIKEIIDLQIIGFEQEFMEYFNTQNLADVPFTDMITNGFLLNPGETPQNQTLLEIIYQNFPYNSNFWNGISFDVYDNAQETFYVMKKAYMYADCDLSMYPKGSVWFKAGYENFYWAGVSAFQFFASICNCMGWIWYFKIDGGVNKLIIQQRSKLYSRLKQLNFNKSINHSISTSEADIKADVIMINNGRLDFGNKANFDTYYEGLSKILLMDGNPYTAYQEYYSPAGFYRRSSLAQQYYPNIDWGGSSPDDTCIVLQEIQDYDYRFYEFTDWNTFNTYIIPKDKVLEIPCIENSAEPSIIDLSNTRYNVPGRFWNGIERTTRVLADYDMKYYGNPAECVFRQTVNGSLITIETYSDYVNTEKFRKNFNKYLRGKASLILDVKVNELITDPAQGIKIINYNSDSNDLNNAEINNGTYAILGLKFNLINETSELKLQRL